MLLIRLLLKNIYESIKDTLPVFLTIAIFGYITNQPINDIETTIIGFTCVILGLSLFIFGLDLSVFELGKKLSVSLIQMKKPIVLIIFAFLLGFSTTLAEITMTVFANKNAGIMADVGLLSSDNTTLYAVGLRLVVAISVGISIVLGVFKILKFWSLRKMMMWGYLFIIGLTLISPKEIISSSYDVGGLIC